MSTAAAKALARRRMERTSHLTLGLASGPGQTALLAAPVWAYRLVVSSARRPRVEVVDMIGRNSYHAGMKAVVSEKGQVTIPKPIRKRLGIGPGVVLDFEASEGKLVASKTVERSPLDEVYGSLDLGEPVNDYIERIRGR